VLTPVAGSVLIGRAAHGLLAALAALVLAAAPGCGGDDDDGGSCTGTDFDCNVVCANSDLLCETCAEPPEEGCEDPTCVEGCQNVKDDPEAIPAEFRGQVLGELNCFDDHDSCDGFAECIQECLGQ
jgi:hypothetical protein